MSRRLLIIDSGATKADWALLEAGALKDTFKTPGIHPFFLSDEEIRTELDGVRKQLEQGIEGIFFYGTGCKAESSRQRRCVKQNCSPAFSLLRRWRACRGIIAVWLY